MSSVNADFNLMINTAAEMNTLEKSLIKSIFLGRKKIWSNGRAISPCYPVSEQVSTQLFFTKIIKKDHPIFIRYWNKKLFAGSGPSPVALSSTDDILDYVKRKKGGICLTVEIPDQLPNNVRLISIKY